jgi:hypothetical protein
METLVYLQLAQNHENFELSDSGFELNESVKTSDKTAASILGITGAVLVGSVLAASPASAYGSDTSISSSCCGAASSPVSSNCCSPVAERPVSSNCCRPVVVRPIVVRPVVVRPVVVRPVSSICCQPVVSRPIYYPSSCQHSCYDSQAYSTPSSDYSNYYSYDYSNYDYSDYYSYSSSEQPDSYDRCNCNANSSSGNYQTSYYPTNDPNFFPSSQTVAVPQQAYIDASMVPNPVDSLYDYQAEVAARVY